MHIDLDALSEKEQFLYDRWQHAEKNVLAALREHEKRLEQLLELEKTFDLRWKADMRAIARWRQGHPERELVFPDHADLVVWLLEELEAKEASHGG